MKKHSWVKHNIGGEVIEIIVRDFSGSKIESFRFNISDKNKASQVARTLKDKYGLRFDVMGDKDMEWLKGDLF